MTASNSDSIEKLRQNLRDSKSQKWGDQMMALSYIFRHPDVTFADLLDGLNYPGPVGEMAALNLHVLMQVSIKERIAAMHRVFWEDLFRQVNINPNIRILDWINGDQRRSDAWQKCLGGVQIVK
jgi:hypothetical protein